MPRWSWLAVLVHVLVCVECSHAQPNRTTSIAPPIPSGPPLEISPGVTTVHEGDSVESSLVRPVGGERFSIGPAKESLDSQPPPPTAWWEDEGSITPVGFLSHGSDGSGVIIPRPRHPTPPPATFSGSSCDFNPWCSNNVFSPDFHSYQVLGGFYASANIGASIPAFNTIPLTVRKGWMLTSPDDHGSIFQGNWECLAGLSAGCITSSYGHVFASPTVHLRRNFVSEGASIVPYTQLGAGLFLSDAYKDKDQRAIGQACEITLQAHVGVRCFLSDRMSVDLEFGYQHISNAGQSARNYGVNSLGAQIGVTYHLPWGQ